jgi:hypothetical protein
MSFNQPHNRELPDDVLEHIISFKPTPEEKAEERRRKLAERSLRALRFLTNMEKNHPRYVTAMLRVFEEGAREEEQAQQAQEGAFQEEQAHIENVEPANIQTGNMGNTTAPFTGIPLGTGGGIPLGTGGGIPPPRVEEDEFFSFMEDMDISPYTRQRLFRDDI